MSRITIAGATTGADQATLSEAVARYAQEHPNVTVADKVTVKAVDEAGVPCEVEGSYQKDALGQIVFVVLGIVGRELGKFLKKKLASMKEKRVAKRTERRAAKGKSPILAAGDGTTAAGRYAALLAQGLLRELSPGIFSVAGGLTFNGKEKLMEYLGQGLEPAAETGGAPKARKARKAAPKKAAAKAPPPPPTKAAPKKAAPKKAAKKK